MLKTDKLLCSNCGTINYYYWFFPDGNPDIIPDKGYTCANHDRYGGYYHVWIRCCECESQQTILYDFCGNKIPRDIERTTNEPIL